MKITCPFIFSGRILAASVLLTMTACSIRPGGEATGTGASNGSAGASRTGDGSTVNGGPSAFGENGTFGGVSRPGMSSVNPGVGPTAGGGLGTGATGAGMGGGFGAGGTGGR